MNLRFDGDVVAVSGAGHGIGRAIAESFSRLGGAMHGCDLYPAEVPGAVMSAVDLTDRAAAAVVTISSGARDDDGRAPMRRTRHIRPLCRHLGRPMAFRP